MKHTKLPWKTEGGASDQPDPRWQIYSDSEELTLAVTCGGNDRANAEFIVRACNAHEDLLAICEDATTAIYDAMHAGSLSRNYHDDVMDKIEAAIKKARGE